MSNSRDIQAQKTRQNIIDCMYELRSTTDYYKIRITDIAKKAGVSVGTVYVYFHSKAEIATTLVHERNVMLTNDHSFDKDIHVVEQFSEYVDAYLRLIQSDGFEFSRGITLAMIEECVGRQATAISLQKEYIVDLIQRGVSSGELNTKTVSPEEFFDLFIGSVNGTLLEWFYTRNEEYLINGMIRTKKLIHLMQ